MVSFLDNPKGLESNIKILKSDNKILQNENKKLINQYVEASNDWGKLSSEYKALLEKISESKISNQKQQRRNKEEKTLRQEYEADLKRISQILDQTEDNKRSIIEKYALEIENLKESYERTIQIQKDNFSIFKEKVDEEFEYMQNKLFKKEEKQRYKLGQPELKNQIKQRDRLSDILRDLSSKESTLKSAKTELKTLKIQIGKLKTRTTDLKDKIGDLHKIIDSNPRAKRMLEQQKGELNQYKPQKTEFGRKSYESKSWDF